MSAPHSPVSAPARPGAFRRIAALGLAALLLGSLGAGGLAAESASAAPRVSITVADRPELSGVADSTYLTEVRVSGSGFQSIQNGFGGIYVLFGWVSGPGWQPSQGGSTGAGSYRYVFDDESNPVGYQLFTTFPGSSTSYAANGGTLAADGTWSSTMKIPGSSFQAYDRSGAVTTVDCLQVQCGIITIGAHGVVNANNESFTPIGFQSIYSAGEGRQVVQSAGEPTAVAPTIIGGRPATIPAALSDDQLAAVEPGAVTAEAGATRLVVTVPGADPEQWLGVTFYSEPIFAGWFKPNSQGAIDVDFPGNLPPGEHRVVVATEDGTVLGAAEFERAGSAEATASAEEEADAVGGAPQEDLSGLLTIVIIVGALALAAVAVLAVTVLRRRRPEAAPATGGDDAGLDATIAVAVAGDDSTPENSTSLEEETR